MPKAYIDEDGGKWASEDEFKVFKWLQEDEAFKGFELQYMPIKGRKFRSDFCWVDKKVILEVQGLDIWGRAGHNNVAQYVKDCERMLLLTAHGYTVLYYAKGVSKACLLDNLLTILKLKEV